MNPEFESILKAAAGELGASEVRIHDCVVDALARVPEHTAFLHMNNEEIGEVHNRIALALGMAGLKGAALDEAIAATFREAARAIERERGIEWKRSKTMRLV